MGPADHRYRERAAEIVAQARLLLTAIDDLDFAARVHTSGSKGRAQTNIAELVEQLASQLQDVASGRGASLEVARTTRPLYASIDSELAERLIFRTFAAMIERSGKGEHLRLSMSRAGDQPRLSISRPATLRGLSDEDLFGASGGSIEDFYLRLVRGLARVAGTELGASAAAITLTFRRS